MKITADELAKEVSKALSDYADATLENMRKAVDKSAKDAVRELKADSPKRTGAYSKSWAAKKDKLEKKWAYSKVVYNRKHYRLTHLLEKGHRIVNTKHAGKKTQVAAIEHIAKVEQKAIEELVKEIKNDA